MVEGGGMRRGRTIHEKRSWRWGGVMELLNGQ